MLKTFKIFKLFGVDIELHWSVLLLLVLFIDIDGGYIGVLYDILTLIMILSIIVIHEFGHIFAGKQYGINTPTIVLNFFGGIALMGDMVNNLKPKETLWVAFAGPLTNLIMFVISLPIVMLLPSNLNIDNLNPNILLFMIFVVINTTMFVFNLLPIFPMDGGRILRALLELFNIKKALLISIIVTQIFCLLTIYFGFFIGSWAMSIIGVVFFILSILEYKTTLVDEEHFKVIRKMIGDVINRESFTNQMCIDFLNKIDTDKTITNVIGVSQLKKITDEFRRDIK